MAVKQLSVYLENSKGSVYPIVKILSDAGIDLRSICIADTEDYGMLRMLTSDSARGAELLCEQGYHAHSREVVAVAIPDEVGGLTKLLLILSEHDLNLEYMYSIINSQKGNACMVLRVDDNEKAEKVLSENGVKVLTEELVKG